MTPMGPPGRKIIFHENPVNRVPWSFNGVPGFYIGHFTNGYLTYKVYIPKTRVYQSSDTVFFSQLKNALRVNNRLHHKVSRRYRNVFENPTQEMSIE